MPNKEKSLVKLSHLNNVLVNLKKAADALEAIQKDLHGNPHKELDSKASDFRNSMLKKTGESEWEKRREDKNLKRKGAGKSLLAPAKYSNGLSYNTFAIRDSVDVSNEHNMAGHFNRKVNDFVDAMKECTDIFAAGEVAYNDGVFDKSQSLVYVEDQLAKKIDEVKSYQGEIKKLDNRAHNHNEEKTKYSYVLEVKSASTAGENLSSWINQLRDNPTLRQWHREFVEKSYAEKSEDLKDKGTLTDKDKKAAREAADQALFNEVITAYKAANKMDDDASSEAVMSKIRADIKAGRRVYINITLNKEKDKTTELSIAMWTTLFSTVSTVGEAILGGYSIATLALGASAIATAGLVGALVANPIALAATIGIFLCVLVVNQSLFDQGVRSLFNLLRNWRIFKNKDGSWKTKAEIAALASGAFFAVAAGAVMAGLTFNACMGLFASLLALGPTAPLVIGIALAIAAIEFVALTGFNFQFFYSLTSNMKEMKAKIGRMFFQGRSRVAKGFLFALCMAMTFFLTIGSFVVGYSNVKDIFTSLTNGAALTQAAQIATWFMNALTVPYYLVAGVHVNNSLLRIIRAKLSGAKKFLREATPAQVAARVAAIAIRVLFVEPLFLIATFSLVILRASLNIFKILCTLVVNISVVALAPIVLPAIAVYAKNNNMKFGDALKKYTTSPQRIINDINKKLPKWNWLYRECKNRSSMFTMVGNAGAMAALGVVSADSVVNTMLPAGILQDLGSGMIVPLTIERYAVSHFTNQGASSEIFTGEKLREAAKEWKMSYETASGKVKEVVLSAAAKEALEAGIAKEAEKTASAETGKVMVVTGTPVIEKSVTAKKPDYSFKGYFDTLFSSRKAKDTCNEMHRLSAIGKRAAPAA